METTGILVVGILLGLTFALIVFAIYVLVYSYQTDRASEEAERRLRDKIKELEKAKQLKDHVDVPELPLGVQLKEEQKRVRALSDTTYGIQIALQTVIDALPEESRKLYARQVWEQLRKGCRLDRKIADQIADSCLYTLISEHKK